MYVVVLESDAAVYISADSPLRTALEHEDWQYKTTAIRVSSESFLPVIFYCFTPTLYLSLLSLYPLVALYAVLCILCTADLQSHDHMRDSCPARREETE